MNKEKYIIDIEYILRLPDKSITDEHIIKAIDEWAVGYNTQSCHRLTLLNVLSKVKRPDNGIVIVDYVDLLQPNNVYNRDKIKSINESISQFLKERKNQVKESHIISQEPKSSPSIFSNVTCGIEPIKDRKDEINDN